MFGQGGLGVSAHLHFVDQIADGLFQPTDHGIKRRCQLADLVSARTAFGPLGKLPPLHMSHHPQHLVDGHVHGAAEQEPDDQGNAQQNRQTRYHAIGAGSPRRGKGFVQGLGNHKQPRHLPHPPVA